MRPYAKIFQLKADLDLGELSLNLAILKVEEVMVTATRVGEKTPVAFTNMDREEITSRNFGQDIPYLLSMTPSLVTSSDAGMGIGYTSMRIRGTDANRINVTINGIPLNDAESHSVYWVDLPDIATSVENIQVQRGVGTSTNGAAAFGASVNLHDQEAEKKPYATYEGTIGILSYLQERPFGRDRPDQGSFFRGSEAFGSAFRWLYRPFLDRSEVLLCFGSLS